MTSLAAFAGDVQREKPLQDVVPLFCTHYGRAGSQIIQRRRNCSGVDARLRFADADTFSAYTSPSEVVREALPLLAIGYESGYKMHSSGHITSSDAGLPVHFRFNV